MFESSMPFTITDYGMNGCGTKHGTPDIHSHSDDLANWFGTEHEPKMWDNLKANFMGHLDEINADLKAASLPLLGAKQWIMYYV